MLTFIFREETINELIDEWISYGKKHETDNMQSWPPESLTNLEKERSETAQKGREVL